jgi:hypothetical protein
MPGVGGGISGGSIGIYVAAIIACIIGHSPKAFSSEAKKKIRARF